MALPTPQRAPFSERATLAPLLALLVALVGLTACTAAETPEARARAFWETALGAPGAEASAGARRRTLSRRLGELGIREVEVERQEVDPEAQVALLPTRLVRDEEFAIETLTVLERTDDGWVVDEDATADALSEAALVAVSDEVREAARALGDALGRVAPEVGEAIGRLARELEEALDRRTEGRSSELADELGRSMEDAGDALSRAVEALGRALEDARDSAGEPEEAPAP